MSRVKPRTSLHPAERARLSAGITVEEAAEQSGLNRKTIWNIEAGRVEPRGPAVIKLAQLYKVDAADFLESIRAYRAEQAEAA